MYRRPVLFAILTIVTFAGCQHDPWADRFLASQPAEKDVVGFYAVDQPSLQRTINLPMSQSSLKINPLARIRLTADHKAEFLYVPGDLNDLQCSVTGRGTWRLAKSGSYIVILAQIADEEPNSRCRSTFTANFGNELNLYGEKPPYRLHITIGDPDSGDAVQFVRLN